MTTPSPPTSTDGDAAHAPSVLVVDDDRDICGLVEAILTDAGYAVSALYHLESDMVAAATARLEPDCILLDSGSRADYGGSWELAERLAARGRRVPVVMFTAHRQAAQEALANASARSKAARFAGILDKPFDIEDLLDTVARAVGFSSPFDRSPAADAVRTQALVERLRAGGGHEIRRSTRREWVTFGAPSGRLVQLYWWQQGGRSSAAPTTTGRAPCCRSATSSS